MASERTLLAAWTAEGADMPKYVNATLVDAKDPEGGIEITVRSPKDLGSTTSVARIPNKDAEQFLTELLCRWVTAVSTPEQMRHIEKTLLEIIEVQKRSRP